METHIDPEEGLWIPPEFREFGQGIVFRTPKGTIQHHGTNNVGPYYGLIRERDFGEVDELRDPQNPELAPNKLSIKKYGEDPVVLTVNDNNDSSTS